jgi:long-chain acyl-CoA synthetase
MLQGRSLVSMEEWLSEMTEKRLYSLALENRALRYLDGASGKLYSLKELDLPDFGQERNLAFAYLSNDLESIRVLWSLLKSSFCVALLPSELSENFKNNLEVLYQPQFIYDAKRSELNNYTVWIEKGIRFYKSLNQLSLQISPEIKLLLNTSGTTGSPKFVKLSEGNIISNALSIVNYLPIQSEDVTPLNLPVYYSYGFSVFTSNSIAGGITVCTNEDVLSKQFWIDLNNYGYTSLAGVPFVYEMLDRIGFTKKEYPSLRYLTQAGGKLQNKLIQKYGEYARDKNIPFYVMYGQTEATARIAFLPPDQLLNKIGSIGKVIPGGELSVDPENNELCYSGDNVFGGYVTSPNDLSSYKKTETLRTGDLASEDEDGFFYITGRINRIVKIFGARVNLDEIESILFNQFQTMAKAIGMDDKVMLVFYTNENQDSKAMMDFLNQEIKVHVTAMKFIHIPEFPLTNNGKTDYKKLKDYAG